MVSGTKLRQFHQFTLNFPEAYGNIQNSKSEFTEEMIDELR